MKKVFFLPSFSLFHSSPQQVTKRSEKVKEMIKSPSMSTALSELPLIFACFYAAYITQPFSILAPAGFLSIALASTCGFLRFSGVSQIRSTHEFFTQFGAEVALPSIFLAFYFVNQAQGLPVLPDYAPITLFLGLVGAFCVFHFIHPMAEWEKVTTLTVFLVILKCWSPSPEPFGLIGVVLTIVAGVAIGVKGELWGFKRVDL